MNKIVKNGLLACGGFLVAGVAAAEGIDVTSVTTGISNAGTALLSVIGALMALSVSLFGISKVYSFIKRKAGA